MALFVVGGAMGGALWLGRVTSFPFAQPYIRHQAPKLLTFEELIALSKHPTPSGALAAKYDALWTRPIVSNEAYYAQARPRQPNGPPLGVEVVELTPGQRVEL